MAASLTSSYCVTCTILWQFTIEFFERKYGTGKSFAKTFKSFVLGLMGTMNNSSHPCHSFISLFGQLSGIHSRSGRVQPLPQV